MFIGTLEQSAPQVGGWRNGLIINISVNIQRTILWSCTLHWWTCWVSVEAWRVWMINRFLSLLKARAVIYIREIYTKPSPATDDKQLSEDHNARYPIVSQYGIKLRSWEAKYFMAGCLQHSPSYLLNSNICNSVNLKSFDLLRPPVKLNPLRHLIYLQKWNGEVNF